MDRQGKSDDWTEVRNRVRSVIRAEIAQFHPTEDARQPLELIVETSLRYTERDGDLVITVVDANGRPRTTAKDGRDVPATIRDVLEELRLTHPALFKPAADNKPATSEPADVAQPGPEPERDWLSIGSANLPSPADRRPVFGAGRTLFRGFRADRMSAWSQGISARWRDLAASCAPVLRAARTHVPSALHHARNRTRDTLRNAFAGMRTDRRWGTRPLAIGAAALVALLAIGAFAVSRSDRSATADTAEPVDTGAVAQAASPDLLRGVPEVLDTATLSLQGRVVRLLGVEWAPGSGKPDDLARYLAGREVVCQAIASTDTYRCEVDGKDLSTVILYNGGGRATAQATDDMKAAAERARRARIGVWSK